MYVRVAVVSVSLSLALASSASMPAGGSGPLRERHVLDKQESSQASLPSDRLAFGADRQRREATEIVRVAVIDARTMRERGESRSHHAASTVHLPAATSSQDSGQAYAALESMKGFIIVPLRYGLGGFVMVAAQ
ncbi:hypothetical protein ACIQMR_37115 [Streptomyces sp. NPDC091376]|uniref:hypothetical protein n=1 Tax=Streptomyces sp. NPDC091376 TaxID=3365994 RepID=UPI00381D2AE9